MLFEGRIDAPMRKVETHVTWTATGGGVIGKMRLPFGFTASQVANAFAFYAQSPWPERNGCISLMQEVAGAVMLAENRFVPLPGGDAMTGFRGEKPYGLEVASFDDGPLFHVVKRPGGYMKRMELCCRDFDDAVARLAWFMSREGRAYVAGEKVRYAAA